ncbi:hypothetical protein ASPCAL11814 [Aspergillus calidoustus]|uniref:Uncharacterized protein n=1 Tax=Aspergillus calidoustus TaxID=454130 RepID=A0A0U5GAI1_ASPCI|nr:hypothetical protein ASPCAL11814 [Aspergillus calidoustus]
MMASVQAALELIRASDLSPTEHLILEHFVESADEPEAAAQYLQSRNQAPVGNVESSLRQFLEEWRSLVSRSKFMESCYCFTLAEHTSNGLGPDSTSTSRSCSAKRRGGLYTQIVSNTCTGLYYRAGLRYPAFIVWRSGVC